MNEDKCEIVCDEINSFLSFENKKWIEKSKFVKLLEWIFIFILFKFLFKNFNWIISSINILNVDVFTNYWGLI